MYQHLDDYFTVPQAPKAGDIITTPVKTLPDKGHHWAAGVTRSGRKLSTRDVLVMNSTAQNPEENSPNIPCELSSINDAELALPDKADLILKKPTETPAKIFARMKAKVQSYSAVGHRGASDHDNCQSIPSISKSQNLQSDNTSQGTYVLALSPPQSPGGASQDEEMVLQGVKSFAESYVLLEKMPLELFSEMQMKQKPMPEMNLYNRHQDPTVVERVVPDEMLVQLQRKPLHFANGSKDVRKRGGCVVFGDRSLVNDSSVQNHEAGYQVDVSSSPECHVQSESHSECTELVPPPVKPRQNLLDDPLLQLSPRVLIPRKKVPVHQSKQQRRQMDEVPHDGFDVEGIHLRDWVLKLVNKDLVVDGIRVDTKIPWHSSFITERISSNVLKTSSGRTYVLIGKMLKHPNSSLPSSFLKKFLFGFPKLWREYLNQFLNDHAGSQKIMKDNNSVSRSKARIQQTTKKSTPKNPRVYNPNTSPITPDSIQLGSAKVSRSGRIIKPPLEYWKGGRIVMDSDMNVTIHEGYCSSVLSTPKKPITPATMNESKTLTRGNHNTCSSEDEMSVPMRKIKPNSKSQRKASSQNNPLPDERTNFITAHTQKASQSSNPTQTEKPKTSEVNWPQRAPQRKKELSSIEKISAYSGSEIPEKYINIDQANALFGQRAHGSHGEETSCDEQGQKAKRNGRVTQKQKQVELRCNSQASRDSSSLRRSSRIGSRVQYSTDSNSSFVSPELPKRNKPKGSATHKQLTKPQKPEDLTSVPHNSISFEEENDQDLVKCSRRPKKALQRHSDFVEFPSDSDDEREQQEGKKTKFMSKISRQRKVLLNEREPKAKGNLASFENLHSEQSEDEESAQQNITKNRRLKKSELGKTPGKSKKSQVEHNNTNEQDALDCKWTEEELKKLHEAVNSLPKHQSGYWVNVAYFVGTRSAEECQERYNANQNSNRKPRKRAQKKPAATEEPGKEIVEITAKTGTLKRRQQMRYFLEHMPKDDHDDIFASSPMQNKQIKLPVFSAKGDEEDFSQLQDPQTPSSSMALAVKTPQCLHISPGMMGSINKNNMDKYIFHLQKNQKGRKQGKKAASMAKCTPTPAVKKTLKRCVAEDEDFVVWNMLSDKDVSAVRADDSDEEDDYFMEYC